MMSNLILKLALWTLRRRLRRAGFPPNVLGDRELIALLGTASNVRLYYPISARELRDAMHSAGLKASIGA